MTWIWACSVVLCPVCPAFVILRFAERIRWTGAFLLRRKKHRHKPASERNNTRLQSLKQTRQTSTFFLFNFCFLDPVIPGFHFADFAEKLHAQEWQWQKEMGYPGRTVRGWIGWKGCTLLVWVTAVCLILADGRRVRQPRCPAGCTCTKDNALCESVRSVPHAFPSDVVSL